MVVADAFGKTGCSGAPVVCQPLWTADLPGGTIGFASQPLVSGNRVYVTTSRPTGFGRLFVFDANGQSNCGGAPKVCLPLWTAAANSFEGPNVVGGVLYVDDDDTHQLQAFDAAGTVELRRRAHDLPPAVERAAWSDSAPSVADGRVFIATRAGSPQILAYDADRGSTGCGVRRRSAPRSSPSRCPTFVHGSVAVSRLDGVYVQTQTGRWSPPTPPAPAPGAPRSAPRSGRRPRPAAAGSGATTPAVSGGRVYALVVERGRARRCSRYDAAGITGCDATTQGLPPVWSSGTQTRTFGNLTSPQVAGGLVWALGQAWNPHGDPGVPHDDRTARSPGPRRSPTPAA